MSIGYEPKESPISQSLAQERYTEDKFHTFTLEVRRRLQNHDDSNAIDDININETEYWQNQDLTNNDLKIDLQRALLDNDFSLVASIAMFLFYNSRIENVPSQKGK